MPERRKAFCTLLTTDSYLAGALVCVNSLLDVERSTNQRQWDTVCLVTPSTVGQASIKALQKTFDAVVGVAEITTESWKELDLLGRKDLAASLTKLHLFRLTQYDKIIFLDADTLVCRPLSQLFDLPQPFAAAPDSGWPDAFNSGVMVATPNERTFKDLIKMMDERGSWDGGDQGLLNDYFSDWHRLSFTYNVTPSAYYTYAPAYRRHGGDAAVLHFIGRDKPWKRGTRAEYDPDAAVKDYYGLVNQWYDVYERHFGVSLTYDVASRVIQPPAAFKSTYTDLPAHEGARKVTPKSAVSATTPAPIAVSSKSGRDSPPKLTWDPATSSPPRDPNAFQMRNPIDERYDNMWDDPSKKRQKQRFQPPLSYPAVPPSTHDWYKDVMRKQPDPSAVKAVFPWEKNYEDEKASSPPPPVREFPPSKPSTPPNEAGPAAFASTSTFTNAWDAIPGINRYAKQLARSARKSNSTAGPSAAPLDVNSAAQKEAKKNEMAGRTSSLKELKTASSASARGEYTDRRSDQSSRDGDDEEDEDTTNSSDDEENRDRPKIIFKRQSSYQPASPAMSRSRSGSGSGSPALQQHQPHVDRQGGSTRRKNSPPGSGNSSGSENNSSGPGHTTPAYGSVDTSPRGGVHQSSKKSASTTTSTAQGSSASRPRLTRATSPERHFSSGGNGSRRSDIRLNTSAPQPPSTPGAPSGGAVSPRLAIRNSAAARFTASGAGTGDGPPVVRATRVFSPETDTGVVKQQGLAALQRFVENFEAATGTPPPQHQQQHQ